MLGKYDDRGIIAEFKWTMLKQMQKGEGGLQGSPIVV
jgi:hypothetical protein